MTTTTKARRDPLSRYFKDLNDSDLDSDESEDETEVKADSKSKESSVISSDDGADKKCSTGNVVNSTSSIDGDKCSKTDESSTSTPPKDKNIMKKLPSAHECFRNKNDPDFLKLNRKREINWDTSFKNLEGGDVDTSFGEYTSNAVPPPSSYEPITDPGIKVVDSEGRKRKTSNDDAGDASSQTKAYRVERQDL